MTTRYSIQVEALYVQLFGGKMPSSGKVAPAASKALSSAGAALSRAANKVRYQQAKCAAARGRALVCHIRSRVFVPC